MIFLTIAGLVLFTLLNISSIANSVVGFLLAGVVPGTTIVIPFWAMVVLWCLAITAVTTRYIETMVRSLRLRKTLDNATTTQSRMPRRRYGSI